MDKQIIDVINDFALWKGDTFRLANEIVEKQKQIDRDKLVEAGLPEAAEIL